VKRIRTTRFGRTRLWRRSFDYSSFYFGVMWWLLRNVRKGNLVVLMTDPPLMSLFATTVIHFRGGRVVNWLQDIYPEIAERLGAFPGPQWLSRRVRRWRNRSLRNSAMNVALGSAMLQFLTKNRIENVQIIPNWADDERVTPLDHSGNSLRSNWGLQDRFTVGYSGNFGRVHRFEALVDAAAMLHKEEHIQFLLIGEGAALDDIYNDVKKRNLRNVRFEPYQAQDKLCNSLGAADVHLVSLHHEVEGLVFPSKFYGVLAAGRPLIFLGDEGSDIARLVKHHDIGEVVPPEDGARLADSIRKIAADPLRHRGMGERARALCDSQFSRARALNNWKNVLQDLV
jgi:glycosyltransferase involved in cell wall biosynthesis